MVYVKLILDTRKKTTSGLYGVKLRLTYNREQKYYVTGYRLSEQDFAETMKPVPAKKFKDLRVQLDHLELKAKTLITKLDVFSFQAFEEKYYGRKQGSKGIYELYDAIMQEKTGTGKIGTAINYQCSRNSLKAFAPKLSYEDVTPTFLKQYEKHLLSEGKSISTVGIYLRPFRAVLNEAVSLKYMLQEQYPFGKRKYVIPESRNIKKALSREDFKKLVQYIPADPTSFEARAQDFWLLSYLLQGMNPKDLLLLKKEAVDKDFIRFIRQKTKDTIRSGITEITVPLLPEARAIIQKWKTTDESSPFVFSFINEQMTPMDVYRTVQQFVQTTNKHLKVIAQKQGIEKKVTCYVARFQFTKAMIDADVSVEYLRQCLGHQNIATTQRYIGSFENVRKYEIARKHLLNFE